MFTKCGEYKSISHKQNEHIYLCRKPYFNAENHVQMLLEHYVSVAYIHGGVKACIQENAVIWHTNVTLDMKALC